MGWVEDTFVERLNLARELPGFWNGVRDSAGRSAREYNNRVTNLQGANTFVVADCDAGGLRYCLRVSKRPDETWIELSLDTAEQAFQVLRPDRNLTTVCRFRVSTEGTIEFYKDTDDGPVVLSTEQACRLALYDFMLTPFPRVFREGVQFVDAP